MNMSGLKNGVPVALIVFGSQRLYTTSQGIDVPSDVQMEGAVVGGASALVVDNAMKGQPLPVRSLACGGLLAGGMMAWGKSDAWMLWLPVGAVSYALSDWATSSMK